LPLTFTRFPLNEVNEVQGITSARWLIVTISKWQQAEEPLEKNSVVGRNILKTGNSSDRCKDSHETERSWSSRDFLTSVPN